MANKGEDFMNNIEFERVFLWFYSMKSNEVIYSPRCFKLLTDKFGVSFNRVFGNIWVKR